MTETNKTLRSTWDRLAREGANCGFARMIFHLLVACLSTSAGSVSSLVVHFCFCFAIHDWLFWGNSGASFMLYSSESRKRDKAPLCTRLVPTVRSIIPGHDMDRTKNNYIQRRVWMSIISSSLDKWRNLIVPGRRESVRTLRLQGLAINPSPEPLSAIPLLECDQAANPSQSSVDKKAPFECRAMIFEALSSIEDSSGLDVNAILSYIEQRYEVPENFRRPLTRNLGRLVLGGKLEKVNDCYKIKAASSGAETSNPENQNDEQSPIATETEEDAASYAAYAIAVAENLSHDAAEARKEADRLAKLAEENLVNLKLAEELYEECMNSPDGYILLGPRFKR